MKNFRLVAATLALAAAAFIPIISSIPSQAAVRPSGGGSEMVWIVNHDGLCASYTGPQGGVGGAVFREVSCKIARPMNLHMDKDNYWQVTTQNGRFALGIYRYHVVLIRSGDLGDSDWTWDGNTPIPGPYHITYIRLVQPKFLAFLQAHGRGRNLTLDAFYGPGEYWSFDGGGGVPEHVGIPKGMNLAPAKL